MDTLYIFDDGDGRYLGIHPPVDDDDPMKPIPGKTNVTNIAPPIVGEGEVAVFKNGKQSVSTELYKSKRKEKLLSELYRQDIDVPRLLEDIIDSLKSSGIDIEAGMAKEAKDKLALKRSTRAEYKSLI